MRYARGGFPVFLDTDVDMTVLAERRAAALAAGTRYSWVTYVLSAAGRVLAAHPDANAAIGGRLRPRVVRFTGADAKLALDKRVGGQRVVLSGLLRDVDRADLAAIQRDVDRFRDGVPAAMSEFKGAFVLARLPAWLGPLAFTAGVRPLARRRARLGTFSVTSLGHTAVDGFHSYGGTAVTLGVGRIAERPVVRAGVLAVAPVLRLSLAFDHRVIDGAEAADVLTDLRDALESGLPDLVAEAPADAAEATDLQAVSESGSADPVAGAAEARA
ncbi:2-oxo acid dehydrogenase subunit E2 [Streptomyces sp. NPDC056161]|uniref:2-oxo acid dehydrogenase subunit E2 n=1 Tax=Streptomyces sp. NPDC056161 TaxID=3345732 RepID=UPI0035D894B0